MSSRFGRNQKRKLKAEIAELKNKNGWLKHELGSLRSKGADNQRVVDDLTRILPLYSGLLPPETIDMSGNDGDDTFKLVSTPQYDGTFRSEKAVLAERGVHSLTMIRHRLEFEPILKLLRVYVRIPHGDGSRISLAISDELLAVIPEDSLTTAIAQSIAPSIVELFRSGTIRRKV